MRVLWKGLLIVTVCPFARKRELPILARKDGLGPKASAGAQGQQLWFFSDLVIVEAPISENRGMNALNIVEYTQNLGVQAKVASAQNGSRLVRDQNQALKALARLLRESIEPLQLDNAKDLEHAMPWP